MIDIMTQGSSEQHALYPHNSHHIATHGLTIMVNIMAQRSMA